MSALSTSNGFWYRLSESSGRFTPCSIAPGDCDNIACVTGFSGDPESVIWQAINAAATIPAGTKRWTVDSAALVLAFKGSTKIALTPA